MKKVQYQKATLNRLGKVSTLTLAMGSTGGDSNSLKKGMGN